MTKPSVASDIPEKINNNYFQSIQGIESEKDLRRIISAYPNMLDKRVQKALDALAIEFIDASSIAIIATSSNQNRMFPLQINKQGLSIRDNLHFSFAKTNTSLLRFSDSSHLYASIYFLAEGIGHGLRVNGIIAKNKHDAYLFTITEVYFHCARAAARAAIWSYDKHENLKIFSRENFIKNASFLVLKTMNHEGKTELSPRGDNPGFVKQLNSNTLLLPERPGNKIAVSLRNIIQQPDIELFFFTPYSDQTLSIFGKAKVITDKHLLEQCAVKGKHPKAGILIQIETLEFARYEILLKNNIGHKNLITKPAITSFSKALSIHINGTGLVGKATSAVVGAVVKHDMKNLY